MTYKSFEELPVWQDAREMVKTIYQLTDNSKFSRDYRFKSQICAAAVSVLSNISEGFELQSKKQFIKFLYIAKGSCGEVRAQAYVALDIGYMTSENHIQLKTKAEKVSKQIARLIAYLERE